MQWRLKKNEVGGKQTHCIIILYTLPTFLYFMVKIKLSSKIMALSFGNILFHVLLFKEKIENRKIKKS